MEGGGRLIGEADHFFDLTNYFSASQPIDVQAYAFPITEDSREGLFNFMVQVKYRNHSIGQLTYTSLGGPKLSREKLELFCSDRHVQIIDFRRLVVNAKTKSRKSDMGHSRELEEFLERYGHEMAGNVSHVFDASMIALKANEIVSGIV